MTYIILRLILNSVTGQPLELAAVGDPVALYSSYEDCERAKADLGPQTTKDGKVAVYTCATEKQITTI